MWNCLLKYIGVFEKIVLLCSCLSRVLWLNKGRQFFICLLNLYWKLCSLRVLYSLLQFSFRMWLLCLMCFILVFFFSCIDQFFWGLKWQLRFCSVYFSLKQVLLIFRFWGRCFCSCSWVLFMVSRVEEWLFQNIFRQLFFLNRYCMLRFDFRLR